MSDDTKQPQKVFMACRRSSHIDGKTGSSSEGTQEARTPKCESSQAIVLNDVSGHDRSVMMYRCVDCGYTWTVGIGGPINI